MTKRKPLNMGHAVIDAMPYEEAHIALDEKRGYIELLDDRYWIRRINHRRGITWVEDVDARKLIEAFDLVENYDGRLWTFPPPKD